MQVIFPPLRSVFWHRTCEAGVLILLAVSVLWRGGKSLDATWLLAGTAGMVTLIVWWCGAGQREVQEDVPPVLWYATGLFVLWTFLSFLVSRTANYGLDEVLRDASLMLLMFWAARSRPQVRSSVLRTLALLAVIACVAGVAVYVLQPVDRFVGTFLDYRFHTDYWPNAFAQFLLLAWPVVWHRTFGHGILASTRARRAAERGTRYGIVALVCASLLLTYSRGALLVFMVQLLLVAVLWFRRGGRVADLPFLLRRAGMVAVFALALALSVNALRGPLHRVQSWEDKLTFQSAEGTSSVSERMAFWMQAAELFWERPLAGWGPYSFRFVQPRLQTEVLATSDHPHNVLLKLAAERGAPALFLFLVICGVFLMPFAAVLLRGGQRNQDRVADAAAQAMYVGILGVLGHNLLDYNLQFLGIALPFWLMVGCLVPIIPRSGRWRLSVRSMRGGECAVAALVLFLAFREGWFLTLSSLGRHAEARGDTQTALHWYARSEGEWFSRDLRLSQAHLLLQQDRSVEAGGAIRAYLDDNREDARAWKLLGDAHAHSGHLEQAHAAYQEAYQRGRWNDSGIALRLARTVLAVEGKEGLSALRPELDALLQAFAHAIAVNAHFIALSPNVEETVALAEFLAEQYPADAPRYEVLAASVDRHASFERSRLLSRLPGFLW